MIIEKVIPNESLVTRLPPTNFHAYYNHSLRYHYGKVIWIPEKTVMMKAFLGFDPDIGGSVEIARTNLKIATARLF